MSAPCVNRSLITCIWLSLWLFPPKLVLEQLSIAVYKGVSPNSFVRSEEHTSELQSPCNLVCRLLLEKKKDVPLTTSRLPFRRLHPASAPLSSAHTLHESSLSIRPHPHDAPPLPYPSQLLDPHNESAL